MPITKTAAPRHAAAVSRTTTPAPLVVSGRSLVGHGGGDARMLADVVDQLLQLHLANDSSGKSAMAWFFNDLSSALRRYADQSAR
jgi:hypothetical protein